MSSGEIFVTFVIPAFVVTMAWAAVFTNEWAIERERQKPGE